MPVTGYRKIGISDAEQIAALYREVGWLGEHDDAGFIVRILDSCHFIGAYEDGRLVGIGRAICDHASDCYIQDIAVASDCRGRGIATEIVRRLVAEVRAEGVDWIGLVGVPGTEKLYRRCGFRPLDGHLAMKFEE